MDIRDILLKLTDALGMKDQAEDQPTMMPPQTQELELLKKAAGLPSEFDNQPEEPKATVVVSQPEEEPSCGCGGSPDEEPLMSSKNMKYPENRAVTEPTGDADNYPPVVMPDVASDAVPSITEPTGDAKKFPKVKEEGIKRGVGGDTLLKSIHQDERDAAERMANDPYYQQTVADRDKTYNKAEAEKELGPVSLVDDGAMWMNDDGQVLPADPASLTDPDTDEVEVEEEIHEEELGLLKKAAGITEDGHAKKEKIKESESMRDLINLLEDPVPVTGDPNDFNQLRNPPKQIKPKTPSKFGPGDLGDLPHKPKTRPNFRPGDIGDLPQRDDNYFRTDWGLKYPLPDGVSPEDYEAIQDLIKNTPEKDIMHIAPQFQKPRNPGISDEDWQKFQDMDMEIKPSSTKGTPMIGKAK